MRKELSYDQSNKHGVTSYYAFIYYNSFDKKRIRLSREYIRQRFGKDITDPDEADAVIAILEKELKTLSNAKSQRLKLTDDEYEFNTLLAIYSEAQIKAAPNSYQNSLHYLRYYVLHYFLNVKACKGLEEWGNHHDDFKEWLETSAFLLKNPNQLISFGSKNHCIRALNTFLRLMHRKRYIDTFTVCPAYPSYRLKEKSVDDLVPEADMELIYRQLRREGNDAEAVFFRLLFFTGMRFNEAYGVSMADIFEGEVEDQTFQARVKQHDIKYFGYLVIDSQPDTRRSIRDAETGHVPRKPLKGRRKIDEKSARIIPIIDERLWNDIVAAYNQALGQYKKKIWGTEQKDYLLFPAINGTSSTHLVRACKQLGIPYRTWHCLRHTRATLLIGQTGDFLLTRTWLGHKHQIVLERYVHIYQSMARNARKKRPDKLRPLVGSADDD